MGTRAGLSISESGVYGWYSALPQAESEMEAEFRGSSWDGKPTLRVDDYMEILGGVFRTDPKMTTSPKVTFLKPRGMEEEAKPGWWGLSWDVTAAAAWSLSMGLPTAAAYGC